jgi:hypothetical protein
MRGEHNMFFMLCFIIGWALLIVVLLKWMKNIPSACTGNCRQGRDCNCMENKNEKNN